MNNTGKNIIEGRSILKRFGGLQALSDVDFQVKDGLIFAIIGPNGAGKTTLFNLISGFDRDFEGEIIFNDEVISHRPPHVITKKGIARTFQNVRLFNNLTVLENVSVGCNGWISPRFSRAIFGIRAAMREDRIIKDFAREMLHFVGLTEKENQEVDSLPLGEQKLLEIARALAAKPKLLLLDEPGAGLNDREMDSLKEIIYKSKEKGITQIIVEHNMKFIMSISEQIMVLNFGTRIANGSPEQIARNEKVIEVYIGREAEGA
jgi:branched-chain amino acid transport system ATP-binding protein